MDKSGCISLCIKPYSVNVTRARARMRAHQWCPAISLMHNNLQAPHTHTHEFPLSCQISSCLTAFCASGVLHREYQMWNVEKSLKHAVSHKQRDHQSVSTDWLLTHTHSPPQCVPFKIDAHGEEEWVPPLWMSWSLCVCVCVLPLLVLGLHCLWENNCIIVLLYCRIVSFTHCKLPTKITNESSLLSQLCLQDSSEIKQSANGAFYSFSVFLL